MQFKGQVLQNPECGTKLQLGPKYHIAYLFETIINKEIYHKSGFKMFQLFYARAVICCYSLGHLLIKFQYFMKIQRIRHFKRRTEVRSWL